MTFLQVLGPGAHVVGVRQPCVGVLAAAAIMAEEPIGAAAQHDVDGGLIDARVNPTEVNRLATSRPIDWFERNLIGVVPSALRRRPAARLPRVCGACRLYEHEP